MSRTAFSALASALLVAIVVGAWTAPVSATPADPGTELWVNPASPAALAAAALGGKEEENALALAEYPSATWFSDGGSEEVRNDVAQVVVQAHAARQLPVLVADYLPYRECTSGARGGARDLTDYQAWIDGFARGIGNSAAIVILEPGGLVSIPWYAGSDDGTQPCHPTDADPATAAVERFSALNYAVDVLAGLPATQVYLDAGHSNRLGVGELSTRLIRAGVLRADGFALNVADYQFTANLRYYGRWVSACVKLVTSVGVAADDCGDQRWSGGPATDWVGVKLTPYAQWSAEDSDLARSAAGIDSRYAEQLDGLEPDLHFVIDTGRNGVGPWEVGSGYDGWCNPPDRGLGPRPTLTTGDPLLDAYLWIKAPGVSDGECLRGNPGPLDPARNLAAPAAGEWFPEMAAELLANATSAVG